MTAALTILSYDIQPTMITGSDSADGDASELATAWSSR